MSHLTTPPAAVHFGRIAPQLLVADLPRALAFYSGVLGFHNVFQNGQPVAFVILEREGAELHLQLEPQHRGCAHNVASRRSLARRSGRPACLRGGSRRSSP